MSFDALVSLHDLLRVYWQPLVRVHHHTEEPGVRLQTKETDCKQLHAFVRGSVPEGGLICDREL